jgi:hypothetical protein
MLRNDELDAQTERIKKIFGTDEVPDVNQDTLRAYFAYLKKNISLPCKLTGIESLGYFHWEERYSFGYGSKEEYERLRKERGSFKDTYELVTMNDARVEGEWDIIVVVYRIPYRKKFEIPLSELQAKDEGSANYQLLDDYSVWFVNWR